MKESIIYARNSRNTYLLIDVLGRTHQDMDLDDRGIHGHSANAYTIGVEISSAGKLVKVGSDFFQAFNVRQGKLVNSSRPPFPGWAMNKGFSLFTPAQVEGLVKLVADLKYCDQENVMGIEHKLGVSGITSHDFHSRNKTDVGHSLFTDVPRFSSLLCDYLACFPDYSDSTEKFVLLDEEIHAYAFKKVFLNDEEYKRVYCSWDYDAIPYWA